jgi:hypothetical protein
MLARLCAWLAVATAAALAACSSDGVSTGAATFTGTVGGQALVPRDAFTWLQEDTLSSGHALWSARVIVTDVGGSCGDGRGEAPPATVATLSLDFGGAGVLPSAGTYPVDATGQAAMAEFIASHGVCNFIVGASATSGTITITSASASSLEGSFDVTFAYSNGPADHVTGTFTAPVCAPPLPSGTVCF